jgi:hypothetical protein
MIGYAPFAGNPLTSITIPSNIKLLLQNSFQVEFLRAYIQQNNYAGGTYRADANGRWRKE